METSTPKLILVPTDFSAPSAHALRYAAALGARFGAHLLVIHADVFAPPIDLTIAAATSFDIPQEERVELAREQLQAMAETNIGTAVPYELRVVVDAPLAAIVAQVRESGADLIVMGTHGRTGLRRLLFGSLTETVMRIARVPVIAVHDATPETAPMRIIAGRRTTPEARAAVEFAGVLADVEHASFIDVPDGADLALVARNEGVDLIALGVSDHDRQERVVQHSNCAVLIVNDVTTRAQHVRAISGSAHGR